ncbi:recombination mediator RecR [Veillonella montpellierensis]|uniref:recombination mediator RecR n=1 Tax=Veillonella montpellierensis TaxID=187328 RepID=UPI0023F83F34|nr:recombination mediator RecR [Veillonella montpellierensis]
MAANSLERLVEQFRRLPGIGAKSARRLAYHLVEMEQDEVDQLVNTIVEAKAATYRCSCCFHLSSQDPCEFCSDERRDRTTILVVETSRDVIAIERSGDYKGLYHVLEGALSPMDGIGADDIRIKELIARLRDGTVEEVILATDPDVEGEATALYLARLLQPSGIKVTRIARGIPVGGDIEYADELTLGGAVVNRQEM